MATTLAPKLTITVRIDHMGFKSYELTHKGGWHHCVSVYPQVDWSTHVFSGYKLNWSCWGDTSIEETKEFAKALKKGLALAARGNKKGGK